MPLLDPVALAIGPLRIHWYGIMYALSFLIGYLFLRYSKPGKALKLSENQIDGLLVTVILGIIIGGRLGYVLIYNPAYYLAHPLEIFFIWQGGLSFHGGLIAVILGLAIFSKIEKTAFLKLTDAICLIAPIGIFLGRIGNFINGELFGRVAKTFCIHYPADPLNCRYPSQLIEGALEGLLLFAILLFVQSKKTTAGVTSALFLILYGVFRILAENFREPDPQIGFLFGKITMGQLLSIIMLTAGIVLLISMKKAYNKKKNLITRQK